MAERRDIVKVERLDDEEAPNEIMSFFLPDAICEGLSSSGFTVQEEIEMLVSEIRNASTIWGKLAADKFLQTRLKEALTLSGAIKTLTAQVEEQAADGSRVVMEKTMQHLLGAAKKAAKFDSPPELEAHDDYIEAEYDEDEPGDEGEAGDPEEAESESESDSGTEEFGDDYDLAEDDDEDFDPERATAMGELRSGHFPPVSGRSGLSG